MLINEAPASLGRDRPQGEDQEEPGSMGAGAQHLTRWDGLTLDQAENSDISLAWDFHDGSSPGSVGNNPPGGLVEA